MNAEFAELFASVRFVLYHKQATSARTLFLRLADGGVLAPEPLPPLATVLEADEEADADDASVVLHPASLALALCRHFGLPPDSIEIDAGFAAQVDTPGQPLTVHLARFKAMDPPRAELGALGAGFCALTELRARPPAEMELLRRAYQTVLGG